jgi:hypothetical protein
MIFVRRVFIAHHFGPGDGAPSSGIASTVWKRDQAMSSGRIPVLCANDAVLVIPKTFCITVR